MSEPTAADYINEYQPRALKAEAEVERLREAIQRHRERVTNARDEHGPPILPLDAADTDLWNALDAAGKRA